MPSFGLFARRVFQRRDGVVAVRVIRRDRLLLVPTFRGRLEGPSSDAKAVPVDAPLTDPNLAIRKVPD